MRVVAAGSSRSPVYPVGEGAAPSPRCSRRQPCRAYPGGFNPDQHGSTFQAEPVGRGFKYRLLPSPQPGIGIAIPRAVQKTAMWRPGRLSNNEITHPAHRPASVAHRQFLLRRNLRKGEHVRGRGPPIPPSDGSPLISRQRYRGGAAFRNGFKNGFVSMRVC